MKTRRILSGISFNSLEFFSVIMLDLHRDCIVDWAYWIEHKADVDDKKDHIHFCFQPNKSIETNDFIKYFIEIPWHGLPLPRKPLSRFNPVNSLDDWLLYCKHDKDYLRFKGLQRNFNYYWQDFCSTDNDSFTHDVNNIDYTQTNKLSFLEAGALSGISFAALVQSGRIPIQYRSQYEQQYNAILKLNGIVVDRRGDSHLTYKREKQIDFDDLMKYL